jgi:hypothetical protein
VVESIDIISTNEFLTQGWINAPVFKPIEQINKD